MPSRKADKRKGRYTFGKPKAPSKIKWRRTQTPRISATFKGNWPGKKRKRSS